MGGFGMDPDTGSGNPKKGGFGFAIGSQGQESDLQEVSLEKDYKICDYLTLREINENIYELHYVGRSGREKAFEIDLKSMKVEARSDISRPDTELFLEKAGFYLEKEGELENPYTLLEQVDDYA